MKAQRQAALLEMLRNGEVRSQSAAVELLRDRGLDATQATVSRDLEELGAVRVRSGNGGRYALLRLEAPSAFGARLAQVLRDDVLSRAASGQLAVLKTPPGHAGMVAAALDRADLEGVLGSIAGDDTVFVCAGNGLSGEDVLKILGRVENSANDRKEPT